MRWIAPPADLRPWLEGGVLLRAGASLACSRFPARVSSQLVVRLSGGVHCSADDAGSAVPGPRLPVSAWIPASARPSCFLHDGTVAAVGLILRPEAVPSLLRQSVGALGGQPLALDTLLGPAWTAVEHAVLEAADDSTRLDLLFGALRRAVDHPRHDAQRQRLLLLRQRACADPTTAAAECGWSRRQWQRRFQASFGLGPKQFQTLTRLQSTLHSALRSPRLTAAELALDGGYCDQSHLGRDLRRLAGAPLTGLLAQARLAPGGAGGAYWPLAIGAGLRG